MKIFLTRFLSAALAAAGIFLLFHFFQLNGLRFLCFLAVVLGTRELIRILFLPDDSLLLKILYFVLNVAVFSLTVKFTEYSALIFSSFAILFFSLSLIKNERFEDLTSLSHFQAKGILGLFYLGLLPAFACKLLFFQNGLYWFVSLLVVVFAGDTFAYLSGMLWGNKKIMPIISPKKTIVGSLGGLVGSVVAALAMGTVLDQIPMVYLILMGLVAGTFGQMGDLFESMLKRVANRKDSGSIMPGHGGVLDRIDGVLFAAPFVLLFAYAFEKLN
jgi:phosphatidate cytidylyltransferase